MPYKSMDDVNAAILGIKPRVTLEMANHIADMADAIPTEGVNPWAIAIANFKQEYKVMGGKWVKRKKEDAEENYPYDADALQQQVSSMWAQMEEAATVKAKAQRLLRDMEDLLTDKTLPKTLRREIEDVKAALRKTWADLEASANNLGEDAPGEEPMETRKAKEFAYDSVNGKINRITNAFNAVYNPSPDITEYFPEDVYIGHPVLGDSVVVWTNGGYYAVAYTESEGGYEFSPRAEWRPVVMTFVPLPGMSEAQPVSAEQPVLTDAETPAPIEATELAEVDIAETFEHRASVVGIMEEVDGMVDPRSPVALEVQLIRPGFGNKRDGHYYPRAVLERDAQVFVGTKMHVTDHKESERSERTEVSVIEAITGYTDDGAPIARVVAFDPDFAEKTRNRAKAGMLGTLECSILAHGTARKGKVDGRDAMIVEGILSAEYVDWVTRAGAGGKALRLAENEEGGTTIVDEQPTTTIEEVPEPVTEPTPVEPATETPVAATPETAQEGAEAQPQLTELAAEVMTARLSESQLPDDVIGLLAGQKYKDEEDLGEAIKKARNLVAKLRGDGRPFAHGAAISENAAPVESPDARFNRIMREIGLKEV